MAESFRRLLGRPLSEGLDSLSPAEMAQHLWHSPAVLLSHNNAPDPVFTYANLKAQQLFGYSWEEFLRLPSRLSAEPAVQADRERLLREAEERGYSNNYQGVRIAKDGSRFRIEDVVLWNVADEHGERVGQAAIFSRWQLLGGSR